ncbi:hypothetical protein ACFLTE_02130 [Bacteroidota bacterium]
MKIFTLLTIFAISVFSLSASQSDLFSYNAEEVETHFQELNELENHILNTNDLNLDNLIGSAVCLNSTSTSGIESSSFSIDDMDWGAFAWGFCCCPIGFFVVAINDEKDSDQKLSYWIGVGVSAVLGAISSPKVYSYY